MKLTTDEVLAWAREAGYTKVDPTKNPIEILERFAALAYAAGVKAMKERFEDKQLWLWRNGDHYLAFEHLYPCYSPGGDPMTLGEPAAVAFFRGSYDRELGDDDD